MRWWTVTAWGLVLACSATDAGKGADDDTSGGVDTRSSLPADTTDETGADDTAPADGTSGTGGDTTNTAATTATLPVDTAPTGLTDTVPVVPTRTTGDTAPTSPTTSTLDTSVTGGPPTIDTSVTNGPTTPTQATVDTGPTLPTFLPPPDTSGGACTDRYEPNEFFTTGGYGTGMNQDGSRLGPIRATHSSLDTDAYRLFLPPSCTLYATYDNNGGETPVLGAADVFQNTQLAVGFATDAHDLELVYTNATAQGQAIDVVLVSLQEACVPYDLELWIDCAPPTVPPVPTCTPDPLEPNDFYAFDATPTGVGSSVDVWDWRAAEIAPADTDAYSMFLADGCTGFAMIDHDSSVDPLMGMVDLNTLETYGFAQPGPLSDLEAKVVNRAGRTLEVQAITAPAQPVCLPYQIYVFELCPSGNPASPPPGWFGADTANAPPPFDSGVPTVGTCGPTDPFEPSSLVATYPLTFRPGQPPARLEDVESTDGADDDVYEVVIPPRCALRARIDFDASAKDLELRVLAASGTIEAQSDFDLGDREWLVWMNRSDLYQTRRLHVVPATDACATYDLTADVVCADGGAP